MCPVGLLTVDCFVHVVGPNRGIEFDRGLIQSAQSAAWTLYLRAHFSRRQRQRNGRLEGVGAGCRGLQTVSSSLLVFCVYSVCLCPLRATHLTYSLV